MGVGAGGSDGPLHLVGEGRDCTLALPNDPACATVNEADTPAPWSYTPKFGLLGTFPFGSFFEGGINVTRLLGTSRCFSYLSSCANRFSRKSTTSAGSLIGHERSAVPVDSRADYARSPVARHRGPCGRWWAVGTIGRAIASLQFISTLLYPNESNPYSRIGRRKKDANTCASLEVAGGRDIAHLRNSRTGTTPRRCWACHLRQAPFEVLYAGILRRELGAASPESARAASASCGVASAGCCTRYTAAARAPPTNGPTR